MQEFIELTSTQIKLGLAAVVLVVVLVGVGVVMWVQKTRPAVLANLPFVQTATDTSASPNPIAIQDVNGSLVEGFPTFPVYTGATIKTSRQQPNAIQNVNGYSAEWEVTGNPSVATIAAWYRTELTKQGWTVAPTAPENISVSEQDLKASRHQQTAAIIIEKGEGTEAGTVDILVDLPPDSP